MTASAPHDGTAGYHAPARAGDQPDGRRGILGCRRLLGSWDCAGRVEPRIVSSIMAARLGDSKSSVRWTETTDMQFSEPLTATADGSEPNGAWTEGARAERHRPGKAER